MSNYFRITGYCEQEDFCFIMDSNGYFEKLWQFSSLLLQKGLKVLEVSNSDTFLDGNIERVDEDNTQLFVKAHAHGKPVYVTQTIDGVTYKAVKIEDKIYIPDKAQTV